MKKIIFLILAVASFSMNTKAQNDLKARLEFEEAEKAFTNNDFTTSLSRLNEAEKLLGKTSTKILYLKVLSQNQLIALNPYGEYDIVVSARKNCEMYIKLSEKKTELYDKYKEIYAIKKELEAYPATLSGFTAKKEELAQLERLEEERKLIEKNNKEKFIKDLFERTNFTFEKDKPLDYYASKYPEFNTFIKKSKATTKGSETTYTFRLGVGRVFGKLFRVEISHVIVKENKVVLVSYTLIAGKKKEKENVYNEYDNLKQQALNNYGSKNVSSKTEYYSTITDVNIDDKGIDCRISLLAFDFDNIYTLSVSFHDDYIKN